MTVRLLLRPGPVQVPQRILEAGATPPTHHSAPEFQVIFKRLLQQLRPIFGNDGAMLIQNSSGRGAMEAAITNLFSPGDAVAVIANGRFGLRFASVAQDMGIVVHRVSLDRERTASEGEIAEVLAQHPEIKGLIGSLCETATGIINDLDMIGRMGSRFGVITVVDAVSAAGGMPIRMKDHNIDVCFSGIQKCFMCPAGLAIVATNERVWDAIRDSKHYRHYWNWMTMRELIEGSSAKMKGTVPEALVRCLACAVDMMHEEGLEHVYARHALLAEGFRAFVHATGCELVASERRYLSNTVSAMRLPPGMSSKDVVRLAMANDSVALSAGLDEFKDTTVRMGHMGPVQPDMLLRGVRSLARAMSELGLDAKRGQSGVDACAHTLGLVRRKQEATAS